MDLQPLMEITVPSM